MCAKPVVTSEQALELSVEITAAYLSRNEIAPEKIPKILRSIHEAISSIASGGEVYPTRNKPAVPIKNSVTDEHIICLEDGARLKMLKRYLRTHYDLSPEEYRQKWGLPPDYPMVAPNYSKLRSKAAIAIGLGKHRGGKAVTRKRRTKRVSAAAKSKPRKRR